MVTKTYQINRVESIEQILAECRNAIDNGRYPVPCDSPQKQKQEIYNPIFKIPVKSLIKYIFNNN